MENNDQVIKRFYAALARRDADGMTSCYAPDILFSDPIFTDLKLEQVKAMWRMLLSKSLDLKVKVTEIRADMRHGRAHWEASYRFGPKDRPVLNAVDAEFEFRDGLIWRHRDRFDFAKWVGQAVGMHVRLMVPLFPSIQAKARVEGHQRLDEFMERRRAG